MTMKAVSSSEKSPHSSRSIWRNIPEDWNLHQHRCGNHKTRVNPMFAKAGTMAACCIVSGLKWPVKQGIDHLLIQITPVKIHSITL